MLMAFGVMVVRSSGTHCPAILGNELYTRPASSPATNAPDEGREGEGEGEGREKIDREV